MLLGSESFIPLHIPGLIKEEQFVTECISSNFVSTVGSFVDRFEEIQTYWSQEMRFVREWYLLCI